MHFTLRSFSRNISLFLNKSFMFWNKHKTMIKVFLVSSLLLGELYIVSNYKITIGCVSTYDNTDQALVGILCPGLLGLGNNNTWSIRITPIES